MVPGKSKFFLVSINIHMDYIQIFSSGKVRFWLILSKLEVMNYFLQILTFYWCISSTPKFQFADGQYRSWDLKDGQFLQYGKVTSQNWVSKTHIIDVAKNINIKSRVGKVGGCCRRRRRMRAGNGVEMKYNCSLSYIISQITDIPTIISHIADIPQRRKTWQGPHSFKDNFIDIFLTPTIIIPIFKFLIVIIIAQS